MRSVSILLVLVLTATPALAQEKQPTASPITGRGAMFWSGIALGAAGVTTAVLGVTVDRVGESSTGNAPAGTYQACVAQTRDPVYATNNCDVLKGKNRTLLWTGVTVAALGAVLTIGGAHTHAELSPGFVRLLHTIRF
jgi:hypothetical protein